MKENNGKKLKSLALVMVMLMAALTVMIIVNVETTKHLLNGAYIPFLPGRPCLNNM